MKLLLGLAIWVGLTAKGQAGEMLVYLGTYTGAGSTGVHVARLDTATGAMELTDLVGEAANPSFVALHPSGRFLYACSEVRSSQGRTGGAVVAFAIDPATGGLTRLNETSTRGAGPCHVVVDATGNYVFAANYGGGSACLIPLGDDGRVAEASDFHQHEGRSVDERRQSGPHAHSTTLSPDNRFAYVCDLGLDKVLIYRFDPASGKFPPADPPFAPIHGGGGPRHMAFHPNGRLAYVINELDSTITAFNFDPATGSLSEIESVPTLPTGFDGRNSTADIHIHPNGRFLYGSNRGHDSLAIYAIDEATGRLTLLGHEPTRGRNPRNFGLDPTGTWLLAANQDGDNVVSYRIDPATGRLTWTGHELKLSKPVCVKFLARN